MNCFETELSKMITAERITESERLRRAYEAFYYRPESQRRKARTVAEIRKACGCED